MVMTLPEPYQTDFGPILNRDLSNLEQQLLKSADNLAALIHCIEEQDLGNKREFQAAYDQKYKKVMEGPKACVRFAETYLTSFGQSLDELTARASNAP